MFSKKYLVFFLFLAAFLLVFSQTEPLMAQVPGILGIADLYAESKTPEVGTYVIYKLSDNKTRTESILKHSIVGKEKVEREESFWYEIEQTEPKTGSVTVIKLFISGNLKEGNTIKRMIYKSGKEPAYELPQAFMSLMSQGFKEVKPETKEVGTEKIKTKMGTFNCVHTQDISKDKQVRDTWTNAQVPLFKIVKRTKGLVTLELLEHGTGAVTAVKEKPELLKMPGQK